MYIFIIALIFFIINYIGFLIHLVKSLQLSNHEQLRRNKYMKNYIVTIFLNLIFVLIIGTAIFNLYQFSNQIIPFYIFADIILILFINDTWFYWFHRILHSNNFLKRNIHGEHHLSIKPLPLDYIYAHPLEIIFGLVGMLIPLYIKKINIFSYIFCFIIRNIHEIELHSSTSKKSIIPFLNSPHKHYIHHSKNQSSNYSSMLPFWDEIMNTIN